MAINDYETKLSGGHPNSLGNTLEVVEEILNNKAKLQALYDCYASKDEVVRLRVSNAMKRVCKQKPEWIAQYLEGLTGEIAKINQASTKWTLATLYMWLDKYMNNQQRNLAIKIMQHNLQTEDDWIVQNMTSESFAYFAKNDSRLEQWLIPRLEELRNSKHKSVSKRAEKLLSKFKDKSNKYRGSDR